MKKGDPTESGLCVCTRVERKKKRKREERRVYDVKSKKVN